VFNVVTIALVAFETFLNNKC